MRSASSYPLSRLLQHVCSANTAEGINAMCAPLVVGSWVGWHQMMCDPLAPRKPKTAIRVCSASSSWQENRQRMCVPLIGFTRESLGAMCVPLIGSGGGTQASRCAPLVPIMGRSLGCAVCSASTLPWVAKPQTLFFHKLSKRKDGRHVCTATSGTHFKDKDPCVLR